MVLLVAVQWDGDFLVEEVLTLLGLYSHTKETLLQALHNILFALQVLRDVVVAVAVMVEQVVDSVVAQVLYKVVD